MPGGPGAPAPGGPQIFPPQNSPIPPHKSVGPFTGGTSTENAPGSAWNPRSWFQADPNATFQQGQPMNGPGGGFNPLAMFGNMNPYARAAIAGAGVMQPTPTAGPSQDQAPTNLWMQRPSGVGGMPGPQVTNPGQPHRPYSPTPQNYPSWSTPGAGGSSGTAGPTPTGSPSDTPTPGGSSASSGSSPLPPRRPRNLGGQGQAPSAPAAIAANPRFGTVQYQVPSGRGPLSSNPIYTTLNLADLFKGRRS
jgi:hypothetical protein